MVKKTIIKKAKTDKKTIIKKAKTDKKDEIKDNEASMEFFMEWEIYKNLQVFCNKYGKYDIVGATLNKSTFTKDLQFDNNIKLETTKNNIKWSFYIVSDETKQLYDILLKDESNMVVIYPSHVLKPIGRIVEKLNIYRRKHDNKNIIKQFKYDKFKIIFPERFGSPKYEILSESESLNICNYFKTVKQKFNKVILTDPLAVWYDVQQGDLVEVTSTSEVTGQTISYRYCI